MSSIVNPQGPETPDTYWKRRAAVIALAVAALALLWWLLSALFGGSGNDDQTTSAVPSNTPGKRDDSCQRLHQPDVQCIGHAGYNRVCLGDA